MNKAASDLVGQIFIYCETDPWKNFSEQCYKQFNNNNNSKNQNDKSQELADELVQETALDVSNNQQGKKYFNGKGRYKKKKSCKPSWRLRVKQQGRSYDIDPKWSLLEGEGPSGWGNVSDACGQHILSLDPFIN